MAGLLASLDGLVGDLPVSVNVSVSVGQLGDVVGAVEKLTKGPDVLASLRTAIAALPLPPGLEGLGQLSAALTALPTLLALDPAAALAPVLTPIAGLRGSIRVSATGNFGGIVELLRAGIAIATGRQFGGPQGMPDAATLPQQQKPTLAEMRAAIVEARAVLQALGPFDAPSMLQHLLRASAGFRTPLIRFMPVPLIEDLMQPLATVEGWRGQSGAQLAASLSATLGLLARIFDLPTTRVAQPILDGAMRLQGAAAEAQAMVVDLQDGTRHEAVAGRLRAMADILDADRGPFGALRELPNDLTHARLVAMRAVEPPFEIGPLMERVRGLIALMPTVEADPLKSVADGIAEFDLSALTDALGAVRSAVDTAVKAAADGRSEVRDRLLALLQPVDQAIVAATGAFDPAAVTAALAAMPGQLQGFVDGQIAPVVQPLQTAIGDAVAGIAAVTDAFDPARLMAPIRAALTDAAALIDDPAVAGAFAEVERVLNQVVAALEGFDLSGAADEVVGTLDDLKGKMKEIDPAKIPDAAKPPLREAVKVLTDIDFKAEISVPIEDAGKLAAAGAGVALRSVEEGLEEVRIRVEKFRPSVLIGAGLAAPFAGVRGTLEGFRPGQLLGQLQGELNGLASRAHVLDAGTVLGPLRSAHAQVMAGVAQARPSKLLAPVNAAIEGAISDVLAASHFDDAFDGVQDIVTEIQTWVGFAAELSDVLDDAAALFSSPGDGEQVVREFVDSALDRLDPLQMADLATAFATVIAANQRNERAAVAAVICPALREADAGATALAKSAGLKALTAVVTTLPAGPASAGVKAAHAAAMDSLASWNRVRDDIDEVAGALFERLQDYAQADVIEGGSVLAPFMKPPQTVAQLKATIRPALEDAVREPLLALNAALAAISPYLAGMAGGLSQLIGAAHNKVEAITGEAGIGGVVESIDTLVDQLRSFDLAPISDPLNAVFARIEAGVAGLSPEGLEDAIDGANAAVKGLLDLGRLVPDAQVRALDSQYRAAVQKLLALDPSAVISAELDPLFENLMAGVLPLFELPKRLRGISDAAVAALTGSVGAELGRVEQAFDDMLRAIPLQDTGGPGTSVSVSASVSVG